MKDSGTVTLYDGYKTDLNKSGFRCFSLDEINDFCTDGIILPDGTFVFCGYMGHHKLFNKLSELNITNYHSSASENTDCILISSSQLHGNLGYDIFETIDYFDYSTTQAQEETLFHMKDILLGFYGDTTARPITYALFCIENKRGHGGKYNNLNFLKKYYPNVKLPKFSLNEFDFLRPRVDKLFIRTSPKNSIPGLLNSKLIDFNRGWDNEHDAPLYPDVEIALERKFIYQRFEKILKETDPKEYELFQQDKSTFRYDDRITLFYQEYIEGLNGVCNFSAEDGFTYSLSSKQGNVVKGLKGDAELSDNDKNELETIAELLHNDLGKRIVQLEFVVNDSGVHIVQLRCFERGLINHAPPPENALTIGKTFSSNWPITIDVNDILVVDSDCESEKLLGKKALIVKGDENFSHILALSKVLRIPSIYAVKKFNLPTEGEVVFDTRSSFGWVAKK